MRDIVITGSGRSGTSLAAGIVAGSGAFVGGVPHEANEANPKGFFETHEVGGINEALLAPRLPRTPRLGAGQRWLGIPAPAAGYPVDPALDEAIARLTARRPFCFKDPRFVWTLDAWRPHLKDPTIVCVFREPAVTAASIVKECASAEYLAELDVDYERAIEVWTALYREALERSAREPGWRFLHYDQLLTPEGLDRLAEWTGAELARDFPDAALRRTRCLRSVPLATAALYDKLCSFAGFASTSSTIRVELPPKRVPPSAAAPELSVVLCTYNRKETLARALASWQRQTAAGRFELVVVNDGSTDGTRELLDGMDFLVPTKVVHRPNGKLAAARNTGIEAARGGILLFVNDDTIAFPELVEEHLAMHARLAPRRAAVLGTFEQPPGPLDGALTRCLERSDLVFRYGDMVPGETYDANRFWTANVSVDAGAVREAGAFDESFQHYGAEDVDLGIRLERLGVPVVYHDAARAHHEHVLDLDDFRRRTRLVGRAFVRLFRKHPERLAHADFAWIRGESVVTLERRVAEDRARVAGIEEAARELAELDLGALERSEPPLRDSADQLVERVLEELEHALNELNVHWWREGFAAGLREFGLDSFAALEAEARRRDLPDLTEAELEAAATAIVGLRDVAAAGEVDAATIDAIRLGAALAVYVRDGDERVRDAYVAVLNDLAVLRFQRDDRRGARRFFQAALDVDPENELARENLADVKRVETAEAVARPMEILPAGGGDDAAVEGWIQEVLDLGARVGLAGRHVVELGAVVPERAARATGAASWRACRPNAATEAGAAPVARGDERYRTFDADPRRLPFPDASCDVVLSAQTLQRTQDVPAVLAEVRRVLRPGGAFVASFAPIWSCAVGHALYLHDDEGGTLEFMDGVLPAWAHLLLTRDELAWYLGRVSSPAAAYRAVAQVLDEDGMNRHFEADWRRLIEASGLDASGLVAKEPWEGGVPTPALRAMLEARFPGGGDFSVSGFEGVLRKTPAPVHAGA